jgi:hypothetical protein
MVLLDGGVNRVRDLFDGDVFKCQAGTGTTSPSATDTGLETADSNTLLTPTTVTADKSVQVTHTIPAGTGTGNAYSEQELQINSGSTSANRIVHTALTKGIADELIYITNFFFRSV